MQIEPLPFRTRRTSLDENEPWNCSRRNKKPTGSLDKTSIAKQTKKRRNEQNCRDHACQRVQQHHGGIKKIRLREGIQVRR